MHALGFGLSIGLENPREPQLLYRLVLSMGGNLHQGYMLLFPLPFRYEYKLFTAAQQVLANASSPRVRLDRVSVTLGDGIEKGPRTGRFAQPRLRAAEDAIPLTP